MHKVELDSGFVTFVCYSSHPKYQIGLTNKIDVLNRFKYLPEVDEIDTKKGEPPKSLQESTLRVLMYVFPRQFGLHNVFTSKVNTRETVQPFKDYTLREDEIVENYPKSSSTKIPKRLRGKVVKLIQKLQKLHKRCSYKSLLEYYCPVCFSGLHKKRR